MGDIPEQLAPLEEPAPNDDADRQQRYATYREETSKRQLSNAENLDKHSSRMQVQVWLSLSVS